MKIRLLKGTEEQILAYLDEYELGFCTDTKSVFVKDSSSTKKFVGSALIGTTLEKPTAGVEGRFYYDTTLGALLLDNGSDWVNASVEGSSFTHASAHITGASDEIDGDKLDVDWDPTYYTPATVNSYSTSADNLTSHLKGIDTAINGKSDSNHTHTYAAVEHTHEKDEITDFGTYAATNHTHDVVDVDFSGATLAQLGVVVPMDGSGCKVDITVDGGPGPLTGLTLNAGGTNYQAGDVITISGGNADATATVATINAQTGAVTGIGVTAAGTGYSTATNVATVTTTTRAWTTTAMSGLTNSSTLQATLQAIQADIASVSA